jgi:hypothetical protein
VCCAAHLEHRHLRRGVLHGDAVGAEVVVGAAALDGLVGVVEMVEEDLLGEGQRAAEPFATLGGALRERGVHTLHQFDRRSCGDGHGCFPLHRRLM